MADNTSQGGLDLIATDELTTLNGGGVSGFKVQRIKAGYGVDGDLTDVSVANGLPVDSSESAMTTVAFTSAVASAAIDTTGFSWISIHVGVGYVGQTGLTLQASNDIAFTNPVSVALSPSSSTSSGITTSLGITNNIFVGPIPGRFIRLLPAGAYTSGTQTNLLYFQSMSSQMPSVGANMSGTITSFSTGIAPGISNNVNTIGVATGNLFQGRQSSSADQAATAIVAAVATQIMYVTDIYWSIWGTGVNTPRLINLVASGSALGQHNILAHPSSGLTTVANNGVSGERHFRNPWKVASAVNVALNCAVTSQGAAIGTWEVIVHGYFQSS